jgi:hypothetical protein
MQRNVVRWLGFSIPTVSLVTALHLDPVAGPGEALDGVVSGLWFTLPFAATTWLRSRFEAGRTRSRTRSIAWEFAIGLFAGVIAWALLWLGWTFPEMRGLRSQALLVNSLVMAAAGLMLPSLGRGVAAPEDDAGTPKAPTTA